MTTRKWRDLSPRVRRLILLGATVEAALKTAAIVDLIRTPAADVRGSKWRWAAAIILINTGGAAPLAYFRSKHRR